MVYFVSEWVNEWMSVYVLYVLYVRCVFTCFFDVFLGVGGSTTAQRLDAVRFIRRANGRQGGHQWHHHWCHLGLLLLRTIWIFDLLHKTIKRIKHSNIQRAYFQFSIATFIPFVCECVEIKLPWKGLWKGRTHANHSHQAFAEKINVTLWCTQYATSDFLSVSNGIAIGNCGPMRHIIWYKYKHRENIIHWTLLMRLIFDA